MKTQTTRGSRAEAHYRNAMRKAMTGLLLVMNPQDQVNYPSRYEDLVEYTLDWLKTEQHELLGSPMPIEPGKGSGGGLSLEE